MDEPRVGVLWFTEKNYPRFRELNGPNVPETYQAWRDLALLKEKELVAAGIYVERLLVDPDEFAIWAEDRFGEINADARAAYASHLMAFGYGKGA